MSNHFGYRDEDISFHFNYDRSPDPEGFKMHNHENCEFYCFLGGRGDFIIEGTRYPLSVGSILIMRPSEAHAIEIDTSVPYERISLHFKSELVYSIDPSGSLLETFTSRELGKGNLFLPSDFDTPVCQGLINNLKIQTENQRLHILSTLFPLLNELSRAANRRSLTEHEPHERQSLDKQVISYINDNLSDNLSLDILCSRFYISKPQLCRIFKAATGSTVWEYITVKRLMAAQQLIRNGTPSTKAAQLCGFNDYSVFFRAYRRRFGVSPKAS